MNNLIYLSQDSNTSLLKYRYSPLVSLYNNMNENIILSGICNIILEKNIYINTTNSDKYFIIQSSANITFDGSSNKIIYNIDYDSTQTIYNGLIDNSNGGNHYY